MMLRRLKFYWWGSFWRGWWQWGKGFGMVADKDYEVTGQSWLIGPIQITWWDRANWRDYCYTDEEAAEVDRQENEEMRQWASERRNSGPTP